MFMPHWPKVIGSPKISLGLNNIKKLLAFLGNPEKKLAPIIHFAGTNGKGSTIAFVRQILLEAGYKVDRYTSPHLINFNERIEVANHQINDSKLFYYLEKCRLICDENNIDVTFFEGTTAAAFLAFAESNSDVVLLETGMGGRLDATNVIENNIASVITPISFDHMEYLGDEITKIAGEKAGIIKEKSICVSSFQDPKAQNIIVNKALEKNNKSYIFGKDWGVVKEKGFMRLVYNEQICDYPLPSLVGDHQIINAATAIVTLKSLCNYFKIEEKHIVSGVLNTDWPGRLKHITSDLANNFPKNWQIWFDGGHNEAGGYVLSDWIKEYKDKKFVMICGLTEGKDRINFIHPFMECKNIDKIYTVQVQSEPRAKLSNKLALEIKNLGFEVESCELLNYAFEKIKKDYSEDIDLKILICGSLYLYTDLKKLEVA